MYVHVDSPSDLEWWFEEGVKEVRKVALAAVSTLIAALMLAMPASSCTSDCYPPSVELTEVTGTLTDPWIITTPVEDVKGVNTILTFEKGWVWSGDIVGTSEAIMRVVIYSDGHLAAQEWGTVTAEWGDLSGTFLIRTIAKGDFTWVTFHFEVVSGTGDFESMCGYGDGELDNVNNIATFTGWLGFE